MSLVSSRMMPLGSPAPDFALPDVLSGQTVALTDFTRRKCLLVMFICRHCPYVKHVQSELARIGRDYAGKDIAIVAVSANDPAEYPDDAPESLREMARSLDFKFPLCFDETQETAKAFTAVCTPDFFLFDSERRLVYRGQLDGSRPGNNVPVTGRDLRSAIASVLADEPVDPDQKPSAGCSIKWKPGNEPNDADG